MGDTVSVRSVRTGEPGTEAIINDIKTNNHHDLDFIIPAGPTGPAGPERISRAAYLVSYNDGTSANGIPVNADERLPIDRKEIDMSELVTLDSNEELIKFNEIGYYKVTFTINTYSTSNAQFNPDNDFVSVGLRHVDTDEIYVGTSNWTYNSEVQQLTAQGIISIVDTTDEYELVNLTNHIIFLNSPDIKNINSKSYFANSFLTIIIEYLGRQGT